MSKGRPRGGEVEELIEEPTRASVFRNIPARLRLLKKETDLITARRPLTHYCANLS